MATDGSRPAGPQEHYLAPLARRAGRRDGSFRARVTGRDGVVAGPGLAVFGEAV